MPSKNTTSNGEIFIAGHCDINIGYVQIPSRVSTEELEDGDIEFALISDLHVAPDHRGTGVSKQLLNRAETFAAEQGARFLRISVMAANTIARNAYIAALNIDYH